MTKLTTRAIGILVVLIGIILFILPIPVGWLVIGIGIAFVCGHDVTSLRKRLDDRRGKSAWLNKTCQFFSTICPGFMKRWFEQLIA